MASSPHPALPRPQLPLSKSSAPSNVAADVLKGDKDATQLAEASVEPPVLAVGRRDEAFYEACMPAWRFSIRQKLVASLDNEMSMLQEIQRQWRTPFRDEYFVKTSLLGTHTFFMVFLPLWYWFGYPNVGKGLLYVLAAGGYFTSVLKDACSVPRPYSPPVVRLSVGSHALEYGFPSTHSSNACSMALFFGELVFSRAQPGWLGNAAAVVGLVLFAWSVTFGRLYTGMHSLMDVVVGSTIGVLVWLAYYLLCDTFDAATMGSGWTGTITSTAALLLLVTFHPEPAEECPCFEDAVAFLSVVGGVIIGQAWAPDPFSTHTYGYRWRDATEVAMWSGAVLFKLVTGISAILVWRIIAKEACHLVLPPLFRFFSPLIELPRRHYLRATEYEAYPPNEHLNPVPSILDLPSLVHEAALDPSAASSSSSAPATSRTATTLRNRGPASGSGSSSSTSSGATSPAALSTSALPSLASSSAASLATSPPSSAASSRRQSLAPLQQQLQQQTGTASAPHRAGEGGGAGGGGAGEHKDADVLTKVVVYMGIGWIASVGLPWVFTRAGVSV